MLKHFKHHARALQLMIRGGWVIAAQTLAVTMAFAAAGVGGTLLTTEELPVAMPTTTVAVLLIVSALCTWYFARSHHRHLKNARELNLILGNSEARLNHVLSVTGENVWDWTLRRDHVRHSHGWCQMLGLDDGCLERPVAEFLALLHEDDREAVITRRRICLKGGGAYRSEHRMRRMDGRVIWVEDRGDVFERDGDGQPLRIIGSVTEITGRKAAEDEIRHLAFYDPLTGLPNRRLLLDRLQQAVASSTRSETCGALLFIDLDNFKALNDTLGHALGDLLLQQVAERLTTCVRECDTVARLGGDEFVVMLLGMSENVQEATTQAEAVGEKIHVALNQTYQLAGCAHRSTPSIGITLFADHQEGVDDILKRADLAMYQAKAAGRNTLRFFNPETQAAATTLRDQKVGAGGTATRR
ncbi:MAG: sensor domain-containing diguanylate cyclase [Sulfuritalea sp.]|nr:sensor domain-containing diguanylate cyclase [Sulfuritalea sp.]